MRYISLKSFDSIDCYLLIVKFDYSIKKLICIRRKKPFCIWFDFRANYLISAEENNKSKPSCQIRNLHVLGPAYPRRTIKNNSERKKLSVFYKAGVPKTKNNPLSHLAAAEASLIKSLLY